MSHHDHDDLWQLLGHDRKSEISPFFARNVVREVRQRHLKQDTRPAAWLMTLARFWQIPALGFCAMAIAGVAFFHNERRTEEPTTVSEDPQFLAIVTKVSQGPDYRVIGHLDELMDSEQNSVWLSSDH